MGLIPTYLKGGVEARENWLPTDPFLREPASCLQQTTHRAKKNFVLSSQGFNEKVILISDIALDNRKHLKLIESRFTYFKIPLNIVLYATNM